jgi:hypothetical protein
MHAHLGRRVATALLAAAAASAVALPAAHAGPQQTGCPNGYTVMAVADLAPDGYLVPGLVDDPTTGVKSFGRLGNNDGFICAQAIGHQTTPWGGQLYQFWDNTLPA